ncbi:MAG TPA: DUF58 domain-containing protein, partial [Bacillota bacterium]|nr:DUF58 domain-containing protein [Bacillota bacterium]
DFSEQIVIYPSVDPVVGLTLDRHLPLGPHTRRFGLHEDPARLRGCRAYQPSDSLRRIHWPNMARTGRVQVKEWETTLDAEIGIFLNLCEQDYPVADWFSLSELAIETAASLICHLGNRGERVGFYCNGITADGAEGLYQSKPKQGQRQVEKALSYLAAVKTGQGVPQELLYKEVAQLAAGACLLFITPTITLELIKQIALWRGAGYHPVLLLVQDTIRSIPQLELDQARLTWFRVGRGRSNNAIQLAKSGC